MEGGSKSREHERLSNLHMPYRTETQLLVQAERKEEDHRHEAGVSKSHEKRQLIEGECECLNEVNEVHVRIEVWFLIEWKRESFLQVLYQIRPRRTMGEGVGLIAKKEPTWAPVYTGLKPG